MIGKHAHMTLRMVDACRSLAMAVAVTAFLALYRVLPQTFDDSGLFSLRAFAAASVGLLSTVKGATVTLVIAVAVFSAVLICLTYPKRSGAFVYRYRFWIAALVVAVGTCCSFSGSSIGAWGQSLPGDYTPGIVMGTPRGSRTDEWALYTPMAIAQFLDPQGRFPYFGEVFRGVPTDMFVVYGQPVWDIAMVFRPFQWGYLLFGLDHGLAFFWCARLVALFMATFEFGMMLTNGGKRLSVALAALVAWAPVVQWWFAINAFVEMIVFSEVVILCFRAMFLTDSLRRKILLAVPLVLCSGGFALTLYPAWEIPMAWLTVALLTGVLIRDRRMLAFRARKDVPVLVCAGIVLCAGLLHVVFTSRDAISAMMNTAYPGKRIGTGGDVTLDVFRYPISLFLPYMGNGAQLSTTLQEVGTSFFDFFPLGLLMAAWLLFGRRVRDELLIALTLITVLLGVYCFVGFPSWLAKATLMSYSSGGRTIVVFALANLLLLFRALTLWSAPGDGRERAWRVVVAVALAVGVALCVRHVEPRYLGWLKTLLIVMVLAAAMIVMLLRRDRLIVAACVCIAVVCGVAVNPVQRGTAVATDNPVVAQVRRIVEQDPSARWFSAVGWQSNVTTLAGAKTINATNTYPNPDLWAVLDPDGSDNEVWNRYAHLHATVTSEDSSFQLLNPDMIQLNVDVADLMKLDVGYVLTNDDGSASALESSGKYAIIDNVEGYRIYKVQ
ncbi:hypothetical protein G1C96_1403 [Bifidobacterium sp. DSM 109958]|uniref:Uncharacterized protein n=1 Tax=Bifidobacterium moraviense TaxID=2675323 RepID=A0A7Y0F2H8_9BIFI|nr:hypothetical protein [Bifidobacterium sp. DSM 109958]NMN00824.1 hypothetical protein [Bifidobacterium sp. DSM 109958]